MISRLDIIELCGFLGLRNVQNFIWTTKPFVFGGYFYATDGHVLVRGKKTDLPDSKETPNPSNFSSLCRRFEEVDDNPVSVPLFQPLYQPTCTECGGSGEEDVCPECGNSGEVAFFAESQGEEFYVECPVCENGDRGFKGNGLKTECSATCCWRGVKRIPDFGDRVKVGSVLVDPFRLALFNVFANVRFYTASPRDPMLVTFDGGEALVMGLDPDAYTCEMSR